MKKKTTKRMSIRTAVSAQCMYVPEIVNNKDVFVSKKYIQMADIALSDHNMNENTNLEFQEIVKADRENKNICSGCFYYLSIKVKAKDYIKLKIINKMVWKGSAMDLLPGGYVVMNQIPTSTLLPVSNARTQKLVTLALNEQDTLERTKLCANNDIVVGTQFLGNISKGAGYIKFTKYYIYFRPKEKDQEVVCISILHRKWLYTLDDSVADSLRQKVLKPEDLFSKNHPLIHPPLRKHKKVDYQTPCVTVELLEIDLFSPEILTCAWCAIEDYNFQKGAHLELLSALKVRRTDCEGVFFDLTLKVDDQGVLKIFNAGVWLRPWLKSVNVESSLIEVSAPAPKRARKLLHDAPVRVTRSKVAKSTI